MPSQDTLTRHNSWTEQWQIDDAEMQKKEQGDSISSTFATPSDDDEPVTLGFLNVLMMIARPADALISEMVAAVNVTHLAWIANAGASTVETALDFIYIICYTSIVVFSLQHSGCKLVHPGRWEVLDNEHHLHPSMSSSPSSTSSLTTCSHFVGRHHNLSPLPAALACISDPFPVCLVPFFHSFASCTFLILLNFIQQFIEILNSLIIPLTIAHALLLHVFQRLTTILFSCLSSHDGQ
jgi:hypothetical protein